MKTLHKTLIILSAALVFSCGKDGENTPKTPSVNDVTATVEAIYIDPAKQIETQSFPNFVSTDSRIYVQELTSNPQTNNARIWEYDPQSSTYTLKDGRCRSCSWGGGGLKLFAMSDNAFVNINNGLRHVYSIPTGLWRDDVPLTVHASIRTKMEVISINNGDAAYFLGGADYSQGAYDTGTKTFLRLSANYQWTNPAPYIQPVMNAVLVHDGGNYLYAMGGNNVNPTTGATEHYKTFARYNISANEWEELTDMPTMAGSHYTADVAAFVKNRYIVISKTGLQRGVYIRHQRRNMERYPYQYCVFGQRYPTSRFGALFDRRG